MVNFIYNIEKDAENWVETVKDVKPSWGINYEKETIMVPNDLKNQILKLNDKEAIELVKNYFKSLSYFKFKEDIISEEVKALDRIWSKKEPEFFKILKKIFKKEVSSEKITAYFTTMFICPYSNEDYKWFMISMWHNLPFQITIVCHELLHFHFLKNYTNFCKEKGLNEEQIENLKESLTVLLNTKEFNNLILVEDLGYPEHQELRKKILRVWEKDRELFLKDKNGFKKFLNQVIL